MKSLVYGLLAVALLCFSVSALNLNKLHEAEEKAEKEVKYLKKKVDSSKLFQPEQTMLNVLWDELPKAKDQKTAKMLLDIFQRLLQISDGGKSLDLNDKNYKKAEKDYKKADLDIKKAVLKRKGVENIKAEGKDLSRRVEMFAKQLQTAFGQNSPIATEIINLFINVQKLIQS